MKLQEMFLSLSSLRGLRFSLWTLLLLVISSCLLAPKFCPAFPILSGEFWPLLDLRVYHLQADDYWVAKLSFEPLTTRTKWTVKTAKMKLLAAASTVVQWLMIN